MRITILVLVVALLSFCPLQRNAPARTPTPNDTLKSPEVLPDRQVTFRIYAPKATEVSASPATGSRMAAPKSGPLEKAENGVWSITLGPFVPDFYSYSFTVDGVRTLDPKNAWIKPGVTSLSNMFEVPGEEAAYEDTRPVPHGEVRIVWYHSSTLDTMRSMHVYTPPGYDEAKTKYPVLYLLHGAGDDDSGWSTIGRAGFILDNLLAEEKSQADDRRDAERQHAAVGQRPRLPGRPVRRRAAQATSSRMSRRTTASSPIATIAPSPDCRWAARRPCGSFPPISTSSPTPASSAWASAGRRPPISNRTRTFLEDSAQTNKLLEALLAGRRRKRHASRRERARRSINSSPPKESITSSISPRAATPGSTGATICTTTRSCCSVDRIAASSGSLLRLIACKFPCETSLL